ncbi:MAG: phosphoglucomutase [Flavobacteriales bacterium]|nr:phosphoglucomutase [Candidatus Arcticimaribacter sp.]
MKDLKDIAASWLQPAFDVETQKKVAELFKNPLELEDAFYKNLEFGTGGMRGIMGVGTNRINKYTLGKSTQGLSKYLKKEFPSEKIKVVIAYDCRHNSKTLAKTVADIFSANNIEVFLFSDLRPTPELSFAVRHLNAHCGIVLTASHNPPEYNGYKVYWKDGGQIVPPNDLNIIQLIEQTAYDEVCFGADESKIHAIDREIDEAFCKEAIEISKSPQKVKDAFSIVFTSLHGTAITLMPIVFKMAGFSQFHSVKEQETPDGDFPTVQSPNPEDPKAFELGLKKAKELNADILIGTDPDADRFGIAVRDIYGSFEKLNGNQTMIVLTRYLLENHPETLSAKYFIGSTVVSSPIIQKMADHFGVECKLGLTGFKWIAKMIEDFPDQTFICGGEESFGYMVGDQVRDKDAITSALLAAEIAAVQKSKGSSFYEYLIEAYQLFGLYHEELVSLTKTGKSGFKEIQKIMHDFRANPPKSIAGFGVKKIDDFEKQFSILADGSKEALNYEKSNLIRFILEDNSQIAVRPSGTEPKIKFYFSVNTTFQTKENYSDSKRMMEIKCKKLIQSLSI